MLNIRSLSKRMTVIGAMLLGLAAVDAQAQNASAPEAAAPAAATSTPAAPEAAPAPAPAPAPMAAAPTTKETVDNPYGLGALWEQGDFVARGTLIMLVLMS